MYIPTVTHIPQPSAQAQDLGQRIAAVVRSYLAENPGVGMTDVSQAFTVARQLLRREHPGAFNPVVLILLIGLAGLGLFASFALLYINGDLAARIPMIGIAVVVLAIAVAVAAIAAKRNP